VDLDRGELTLTWIDTETKVILLKKRIDSSWIAESNLPIFVEGSDEFINDLGVGKPVMYEVW
jgi:hypothetical protein